MALQADHFAGQAAQAGGEVAAAGADFQHAFLGGRQQRLQGAAFQHRLHHGLAVAERQRGVGIGQRAQRLRHEGLARQGGDGLQHARIQHVPGTDLLFHHVFAGFGVIEGHA